MKLKPLLFVCCLSLFTSAFADNRHLHPQANHPTAQGAPKQGAQNFLPGNCEIEIINDSYDSVKVQGQFDDGTSLIPFWVYPHERAHYIDLFYFGYCHGSMYLDIRAIDGYPIYSRQTYVNSTIRIVPYLLNGANAANRSHQVKVEVKRK